MSADPPSAPDSPAAPDSPDATDVAVPRRPTWEALLDTALVADPADSGPLPRVDPGGESPVAPGTLRLRVVRGTPEPVDLICSSARTTIGRSDDSDILLDDVSVSRHHALIERAEGEWWVSDVGSLNGIYLNRARAERAALGDGDELQVGRFRLIVSLPPSAAGPTPGEGSSTGPQQ